MEVSVFWALTFSFGKLSYTFLRLPATSSLRLYQGSGVSTKYRYTSSVEKWMVLASTAHSPFKEYLVRLWALGPSLSETLCGQSLNFCLPSDVTGSSVHVSSVCRTMWLFFLPILFQPGKFLLMMGIPLTSRPTIINGFTLVAIKAGSLITNLSWSEPVACLNGVKGHGKDRENIN